jgi:hypothetical protein
MKNKTFDVPMVALFAAFLLASGMFVATSVRQISSVYRTVSTEVPVISQLAHVGGGTGTASGDFTGWAWSSNIGWISFNSTNAAAGGGTYHVSVATSSGSLGYFHGYAWSPNVGWISFEPTDVTTCPTGFDTGNADTLNGCNPTVDLVNGAVTGWARILSMKSGNDGGWLHLSGTNHPTGDGGVTYNRTSGAFSGFAWEPTSVGWVDFHVNLAAAVKIVDVNPPPQSSGLGVTCTSFPSNPVEVGEEVTFQANPRGGVLPYEFKWGSDAYSGTVQKKITASASGPGPVLKIKDATSKEEFANPQCENIVVASVSNFDLKIGPNDVTPIKTTHTVRQGALFAIKWANSLAGYTNCAVDITNTTNPFWDATVWSSVINPILATNPSGATVTNLPTSVASQVPKGSYQFSFYCLDAGETSQENAPPVTLRVLGASGEEF